MPKKRERRRNDGRSHNISSTLLLFISQWCVQNRRTERFDALISYPGSLVENTGTKGGVESDLSACDRETTQLEEHGGAEARHESRETEIAQQIFMVDIPLPLWASTQSAETPLAPVFYSM